MPSSDEYPKWILEPLVICALDPTAFLRRELIEVRFTCECRWMNRLIVPLQLKNIVQLNKSRESMIDDNRIKQARPVTHLLSIDRTKSWIG